MIPARPRLEPRALRAIGLPSSSDIAGHTTSISHLVQLRCLVSPMYIRRPMESRDGAPALHGVRMVWLTQWQLARGCPDRLASRTGVSGVERQRHPLLARRPIEPSSSLANPHRQATLSIHSANTMRPRSRGALSKGDAGTDGRNLALRLCLQRKRRQANRLGANGT